ncbi:sensor histidine kinase [Scopulibacillus cellulosilyticus]|uniref:Signal transduction histidine-protein kinase ArlS n=1 Tax=Scopulibacillus cellulosilyticus TaxID=2665665 RepID=A0ABW2PRG2_9BACL
MKLRSKIYLFSTGILFIILLLTNIAIYFLYVHSAIDKEEDILSNQANIIFENLPPSKLNDSDSNALKPYKINDGMVRYINKDGKVIHQVMDDDDFEHIHPVVVNDEEKKQMTADDHQIFIARYPVKIGNDDDDDHGEVIGTLELAVKLDNVYEDSSLLLTILVITSLIALILSLIGGKLLSNLLLKPISLLSQTMKATQESGQFKKIKMNNPSKDELYQLAVTFNKMMDQLEENFEKQKQFVSDASHELKTPLTVIESYAKLLKRWGAEDPDVRQESIEAIYSESIRMKELTHQMLDLASSEKQKSLQIETFDLVPFCKQLARTLETVNHREIWVQSDQDQVRVNWDPQKLKQVLMILLDNALKYSEKPVGIILKEQHGRIALTVKDEGIGISEENQKNIFERFYRVDPSRQRGSGGTGLGLSIAKAIVEQHEGDIEVKSQIGKGTAITIFL